VYTRSTAWVFLGSRSYGKGEREGKSQWKVKIAGKDGQTYEYIHLFPCVMIGAEFGPVAWKEVGKYDTTLI